MRVLRHELDIADYQELKIPAAGFEVLSVARSRTDPDFSIDLWTLGDYDNAGRILGDHHTIGIYIVGTGNPLPDPIASQYRPPRSLDNPFIGTVVAPNGLVWHVFAGPTRGENRR